MYKTIKIENAVGAILAHDITEIRKGEFKGRAFTKGHQIRQEDIEHLRRLGKEHIYVLEPIPGYLHENDAAILLADAFCGPGVYWDGEPHEGKINLKAEIKGVLKISVEQLRKVHQMDEIICSTLHTNTIVDKGHVVASTRAIPLVIQEKLIQETCEISRQCGGILQVNPIKSANIGIVITGNEVFHGRVEDQFEPIFRKKINAIGSKILGVAFAPDHTNIITEKINGFLEQGADLIITSGGMSVDPDDVTRLAIKQAGAVRLRPILITTLTTVLGLLPMALGLGEGAEIRTPMAVSIIAGLLSATFLTLILIPTVYNKFSKEKNNMITQTNCKLHITRHKLYVTCCKLQVMIGLPKPGTCNEAK